MAANIILEADGKAILNYHLNRSSQPVRHPQSSYQTCVLYFPEDAAVASIWDQAESTYPWLLAKNARFVAKPDQLIRRRGKSGLLALNKLGPKLELELRLALLNW